MKTSVSVLVLLALVGCGGGGGGDKAVDTTSPIAAVMPTETIQPASEPERVQPVQGQPQAPVTAPTAPNNRSRLVTPAVPVAPSAPVEQPEQPQAAESVAPIHMIEGSLLSRMLSRRYDSTQGVRTDQAGPARSEQVAYNNPEVLGQYDHLSFIDSQATYWVHADRTRVINQWTLDNVKLDGVGDMIGEYTYNDNDTIPVGNLYSWVAGANMPWTVALSVDRDTVGYKLCWRFQMPQGVRNSCGLFTTEGDHAGIEVTEQGVTYRN